VAKEELVQTLETEVKEADIKLVQLEDVKKQEYEKRDKFEELMKQYDAVLTPVASKAEFAPYDISEAFIKVFNEGVFTAIPNLVGTPALVSGGVQLMGWHFAESTLLSLAGSVERMGE